MSLRNSSNKFLRLRFRNEIQFIFVVQLNNDLKLDRQILWKMPPSSIRKNIYIYIEELINLSRHIHELLQLLHRWNVN